MKKVINHLQLTRFLSLSVIIFGLAFSTKTLVSQISTFTVEAQSLNVCREVSVGEGERLPANSYSSLSDCRFSGLDSLSNCTTSCANQNGCTCPAGCDKSAVEYGQTCGGNKANLICYRETDCHSVTVQGAGTLGCPANYTTERPNKCGSIAILCFRKGTCERTYYYANDCPADYDTQHTTTCDTDQLPTRKTCYSSGTTCTSVTVLQGEACPTSHPNTQQAANCQVNVITCFNNSCGRLTTQGFTCPSTHPLSVKPQNCSNTAITCYGLGDCNGSQYNLTSCPSGTSSLRPTTCGGSSGCTPGTCVNGKRCEVDPLNGGGYVGTHNCTIGNCSNGSVQCSGAEYCRNGSCVNKLSTGTACTANLQCASNSCVSGRCQGTSTNISCTGDAQCPSGFTCNNGKCGQATGKNCSNGGAQCSTSEYCLNGSCVNRLSTGSSCQSGTQCLSGNCENGRCAQGTGGTTASPVPVTGGVCPNTGAAVVKYLKFTCPNGCTVTTEGGVTAARCYENREEITVAAGQAPPSLNGECGQIDALSGNSDATYCGYTEYNCGGSCGGGVPNPSPKPPTSPSPSPTYECNDRCTSNSQCQSADGSLRCLDTANGKRCRLPSNPTSSSCQPSTGPLCLAVRLRKGDGQTAIRFGENDPRKGESITIYCPDVPGADHYRFRVVEPDGTRVPLQASADNPNISVPYTISKAGKFFAQCQICTGAGQASCLPYEDLR